MISSRKFHWRLAPLAVGSALLLSGSGCGGSTAPDPGVSESALHFLSPNASAPVLVTDTVRFYAVAGQDRGTSLYYRPIGGQPDSVRFLAFDVPAGALVQRPDGTPIATGDSLLISIAVADPTRLIVGFEPSGLAFDSGHPAQLILSFAEADSSLTANGESALAMWRQEHAGEHWHRVPSHVQKDSLTVTGRIDGFTVYVSAY
jgi:hypothetical protein